MPVSGKGVITKSIGLQENYIDVFEVAESKPDEEKSGCAGCPLCRPSARCVTRAQGSRGNTGIQMQGMPAGCLHGNLYRKEKVHQRKEPVRLPETFKSNAIKLLMVYHFLQPNAAGMVTDISIKGSAEMVGCTTATVRACNKTLSGYGYCHTCESGIYDGCINIILPEYRDYHKTAAEGGRGYITMSSGMMHKILGLQGVNTLRLNLKRNHGN